MRQATESEECQREIDAIPAFLITASASTGSGTAAAEGCRSGMGEREREIERDKATEAAAEHDAEGVQQHAVRTFLKTTTL